MKGIRYISKGATFAFYLADVLSNKSRCVENEIETRNEIVQICRSHVATDEGEPIFHRAKEREKRRSAVHESVENLWHA